MPKWLFWLALFFVLFLIYTQPTNAGSVAGGFGEFAVDLLDALAEFVNGLVGGASSGGDGAGLDTNPPTGDTGFNPEPAPGSSPSPTFTHTHDGSTHTHSGN